MAQALGLPAGQQSIAQIRRTVDESPVRCIDDYCLASFQTIPRMQIIYTDFLKQYAKSNFKQALQVQEQLTRLVRDLKEVHYLISIAI